MPGNKAILQLPQGGPAQPDDVTIIVRAGVSMQLPVNAMIPALLSQSTVIPSADVLTLNTTTVQVVDNAPAGMVNIPIRGIVQFDNGTTNYATNVNLVVGSRTTVSDTDYILATVINDRSDPISMYVASSGKAVPGDALAAYVLTGDPTAGDSDLTITVWYNQVSV